MSENPYFITGPALISFSGGRTSAYMLRMILDAHGGTLPDDVHVCFANTGKEREETLRFVHECEARWGVKVNWLEWRSRKKRDPVEFRFAIVSHNSASRHGEPFKALVADKSAVPNAVHRWCTQHLKMQVCADFMEWKGYPAWTNVVGLRADEMRRVFKKIEQNEDGKNPWTTAMPMASCGPNKRWGRTQADVRAFWRAQPFDLGIEDGNCDNCFMKSKHRLMFNIRREPERARDWIEMEEIGNGRFVTEYSFTDLVREVAASPLLPLEDRDDDEFDAECGLWCAGEAA